VGVEEYATADDSDESDHFKDEEGRACEISEIFQAMTVREDLN
jgi:hypothetical protein